MKNYLSFLIFLYALFSTNAQIGVGTDKPQTELDVAGDATLRQELKIGGTPTTGGDPGQFGQVLFSQENTNQPLWNFVNIPFLEDGQIQLKHSYALQDETGIQFATGAGDNVQISALGADLSSSWKVIDGLNVQIEVKRAKNKVALFFQTGVEIPNVYSTSNGRQYVRYVCGIFMEDKLVAVRGDQMVGINRKNNKNQGIYTLEYMLNDIPVGNHNFKTACRKVSTSSNYALAIGNTLATGTNISNTFMMKSNLKIDVLEYIVN